MTCGLWSMITWKIFTKTYHNVLKNWISQQTGSEYRPKRYQTKQQQKSHSKTILLLQGLRSLSLDEQNDWTKIGHKIKSDRKKNQKSNTIKNGSM